MVTMEGLMPLRFIKPGREPFLLYFKTIVGSMRCLLRSIVVCQIGIINLVRSVLGHDCST
jgi:hypothetical protein